MLSLSLLAEHICASVDVIECCLTALTRKPHAKHHGGGASPAERVSSWHIQRYMASRHAHINPECRLFLASCFGSFVDSPFFAVISLYFLLSELLLIRHFLPAFLLPSGQVTPEETTSSRWTDTAGDNPHGVRKYA